MDPQLATEITLREVPVYARDGNWAAEPKLDGHRILLFGTEGTVHARGRSGGAYGNTLPAQVKRISVPEGWTVDGELVNGKLWAFDVIAPGRQRLPLTARRRLLEGLVAAIGSPALGLVPQAVGEQAKADLITRVIQERREGFVLKCLQASYTGGRSRAWLKVKLTSTLDAVVLDVRRDGKDAADLGLVKDGQLVGVGRVSTVGKNVARGDVVEIRYLYAADPDKPRLFQPRVLRVRTDKRPDECTISQLRYTTKRVEDPR